MSWLGRVLGFEQPTEKRDIQFSPGFSALLANANVGSLAQSGVAVTPTTALRFSAVLACVRVIAEDVASLPLPLYRRLDRGKERTPRHPLYSVLHDSPNPEMTSFTFRETTMMHLLLWGNAYAEIVRVNGFPAQLWPITPHRVTIRRNSETQKLEYIVSPPDSLEKKVMRADQIMHIPGLSMNGIQGMSMISVARDAIGLGLAGQEFAAGIHARGMRPSLVLEHPGVLSAEAVTRLKNTVEESYSGLSNAQRVFIAEEGMSVKTVGMPLEDAQFIEQRKFSVEEIARIFRVQPQKIMSLERATFNNVEELGIDHVVSTIRPWLVRWEQSISKDLIPPEERGQLFAEFVIDGLLRGDSEKRGKFYQSLFQIGALSINDVREKENMNAIPDGDDHYIPLNFGSIENPPAETEPIPAPMQSKNGRKRPEFTDTPRRTLGEIVIGGRA